METEEAPDAPVAPTSPNRLLLRVQEAAETLGIGRSKIWEMIWTGELPVVRIGRAVRVPRDELEAWVRSHTEWAA